MATSIFEERLEWLGSNSRNRSGKSDKFYEIIITTNGGNNFVETRRWGKFGAKGQTKVLEHWSEYSALSSARSQLAKKAAKGYTKPVSPLTRLGSVMDD